MKKILTLTALVLISANLSAQDQPQGWTRLGVVGLNLSQASFSNWSAGGDNSIAFDAFLNYSLDYRSGKHLAAHRLELAYGINDTKSGDFVRKTNDRIFMSSSYGYKIAENLYVGALMTFNTQFARGYDYSNYSKDAYISTFMAPGYLTLGAGLIWTPKKWYKLTFNPASWRGTFVLDEYLRNLPGGSFGAAQGEKLFNQFGANLISEITTPIMENVSFYSRMDLFSNYLSKPQNIIVNWDIQINMKINRWISAGITASMIYDDNIKFDKGDGSGRRIAKMQLRETLGIGLQAQF